MNVGDNGPVWFSLDVSRVIGRLIWRACVIGSSLGKGVVQLERIPTSMCIDGAVSGHGRLLGDGHVAARWWT